MYTMVTPDKHPLPSQSLCAYCQHAFLTPVSEVVIPRTNEVVYATASVAQQRTLEGGGSIVKQVVDLVFSLH